MENDVFSKATALTQPRLYGLVQTYIKRQLPRHIHPAFKALRDRAEAATTLPQIASTQETTQEQISRVDTVGGNNQDDDGDGDHRPPYAPSQSPRHSAVDLVK